MFSKQFNWLETLQPSLSSCFSHSFFLPLSLSTITKAFSIFFNRTQAYQIWLLTPGCVPRSIIDRDVVDAEDAGQVYPPGGGLLVVLRNYTLSSLPTKIWPSSIYSIAGFSVFAVKILVWEILMRWFILCYVI